MQVGLGWIVDLQATTPAQKEVCIELDGPTHFGSTRSAAGISQQKHVLGKTAIRNKCLQNMGKRLITFDTLELSTSKRTRQKGLELLRSKIEAATSYPP